MADCSLDRNAMEMAGGRPAFVRAGDRGHACQRLCRVPVAARCRNRQRPRCGAGFRSVRTARSTRPIWRHRQAIESTGVAPTRCVRAVREIRRAGSTRFGGFAEPEADIGRVGSFRLLDELGRGGMGIVYRAWDEPLRRIVAVKVLRPEHAGPADRLRLVREAQLASRFQDDHAVTIHAVVDPPDGLPYLVMEYVQGTTLAELLGSGRRPSPRELAELVAQASLAVDAAHTRRPCPSRREAEQYLDRRDDRARQDHRFRRGPQSCVARVRSRVTASWPAPRRT